MTKVTVKKYFFLLFSMLTCTGVIAQNWTNSGGDNLWHNAANWDISPEGGTATLNLDGDNRAIVNGATASSVNSIRVGQGNGTTGELEVTGGELSAILSGAKNRFGVAGGNGTINMSGGTLSLLGNQTQFGLDFGSVGILNLSGGTFIGGRELGGYSLFIGDNGYGEVNISGGALRTRAGVRVGVGVGEGLFFIEGSVATEINIGGHQSIAGAWDQIAGSTLKLRFDTGGITPIHIDNEAANNGFLGSITFANGALLDVGFAGEEQATGSWVVMTWDEGATVTDNGLAFVQGTALYQWSFAIDEENRQLTVTKTDDLPPDNDPPVALDDAGGVGHGREMRINVLANDSDPDGDSISLLSVDTTASLGSAVIDNGWIVYTAPVDYKGNDTFTYTISDGLVTGSATVSMDIGRYNHPGILHKRSDLERMKAMVWAEKDPWYGSFLLMLDDPRAQYNWPVRKNPNDDTLAREGPCHECSAYREDARAAYLNALMWFITEDARHAEKAIEILNAWSSLNNFYGGGTEPLSAGLFGSPMINAAEIIRHTYDGWAAEDIKKFEDMLVYPGYSNIETPPGVDQRFPEGENVTFYWRTYMGDSGRFGNQGLLAWRTVQAIGIFLDNPLIYDRAVNYVTGQPHRPDDFPYTSGPPIVNPTPTESSYDLQLDFRRLGVQNEIEDYGYDDQIQWYIRENGQCQELSRDQGHAVLGMSTAAEIAEVAWNQGDDVFGYLENRILKGLEYALRYNVSLNYPYPDQPEPWEPTIESGEFIRLESRCGRWISLGINPYVTSSDRFTRGTLVQPTAELPLAHYKTRAQLDPEQFKWLERWRDNSFAERGYETSGFRLDQPGWGGLAYRRPTGAAGDPVSGYDLLGSPLFAMPDIPGTVRASNYDEYPVDGEGLTYSDTTPENTGGEYRADGVDIARDNRQGFYVTSMAVGEWLTYTVNVPQTGRYEITVRCATSADTGTLRFVFDGDNATGDLALPDTGGATSWRIHTFTETIDIDKGVQTMRIQVGGESDVIRLASISIDGAFSPPFDVNASPFYNGIIDLSWASVPQAESYSVLRSEAPGGPYDLVAAGLADPLFTDVAAESEKTYYYIITAFDGTTESDPSEEVSVNTASIAPDNYIALTLEDNPAAYFRFEETEGTVLATSAGTSVSMTAINDPDLNVDGAIGSGIEFPAPGTSYGQAIHRTIFGVPGSFSVSLWVNPGNGVSGSALETLIGRADDAFRISRDTADNSLIFTILDEASNAVSIRTQFALPADQWTHVAAVYDDETGSLSVYYNGVIDPGSGSLNGALLSSSNRSLLIGARLDPSVAPVDHFGGRMDEVAYYASALSSDIIATLARMGGLFAPPGIEASFEISSDGVPAILISQPAPGKLFQIQYTDDLTSNQWMNLGGLIEGEGIDLEVIVDDVYQDTASRMWFRIIIAP